MTIDTVASAKTGKYSITVNDKLVKVGIETREAAERFIEQMKARNTERTIVERFFIA